MTAPDPQPSPPPAAAARAYVAEHGDAAQGGKVADAAHKGLATARETVRGKPWIALGAACVAGAALGFLVKR